jgi:Holliday junction resolvase RusA-like endonuclease
MTKITIYGKPQGKGRPRFARQGKYVRTYTPEKTRKYEEKIKDAYLLTKAKKIDKNPIKMKITAYFKPAESLSKRKKENLILNRWCDKKPDLDNIAKAVCDALNKIAYEDDSQITFMMLSKEYSEEDKIEVEIERL